MQSTSPKLPKGTPVNLLANINNELTLEPRRLANLVGVLVKTKLALRRIREQNLQGEQATAVLRRLVPDLLEVLAAGPGADAGAQRTAG